MHKQIAIGALLLALTPLPLLADDVPTEANAPAPSAMTGAEIAEHNAELEPRDPAFIRCRRIAIVGSLVKKRVCKTNADWAKSWQVGNQDARDTYDAMNRGSSRAPRREDE